MTKSPEYIIFNKEIKAKHLLSFYDVERFRYADACFESMLFVNNEIPLLTYHQKRLNKTCEALQFDQTDISLSLIQQLIAKHKKSSNFWRIRLSLIRREGLNYSPYGSAVSVLIECAPLNTVFHQIDKLGFYTEDFKANTSLAKYKTANALLYVKAKQFAQANNFTDVLLKNEQNYWIEASSSNLFVVKNDKVYTVSENSGAVEGVFSQFLHKHYKIEQINLSDTFINDADELFLTNAVQLIQPVKELQDKTLKINKTMQLLSFVKHNLLNEK